MYLEIYVFFPLCGAGGILEGCDLFPSIKTGHMKTGQVAVNSVVKILVDTAMFSS